MIKKFEDEKDENKLINVDKEREEKEKKLGGKIENGFIKM